ncbi:hypothetical protein [Plebeiibacterium sediminum]|uniref:START domain-containing protein n=1 Tax=Plebeiibacterium sediminum TaxID=2992112 RepID=A0AAE3SF67_9BACT|nr:hypothetical protein [Plebeiobacterium sediminum]MCW3786722.1 hypothetical protein [Plebeiobacterium sediminum]
MKIKELNASSLYVSEWVCVKEDNGIALHERWVKVNESLSVRERKGIMVVDGSMDEVISFLSNPKTVKLWMKGIKEVRLVVHKDEELLYIVINLPWPFSDRDLVAKYSVTQTGPDNCVIRMSSDTYNDIEKKNTVRIKNYDATWKLTKLDEGKVQIQFQVFSAEPPLFPQWVQEPVLKKVFYQNLLRLKDQFKKGS